MINSVNQQKPKLNDAKSKEQSTRIFFQSGKKNNRSKEFSKQLSTTTLNVNGLNSPVKRHRLILDQKARPSNLLSIRNIPHNRRHMQTKNKRLEKDLQARRYQK
jgi:hypothetical protein